jgi:hypothetical protein
MQNKFINVSLVVRIVIIVKLMADLRIPFLKPAHAPDYDAPFL